MAPYTITTTENIEGLRQLLDSLVLKQEVSDGFVGAKIPVEARMILRRGKTNPSDQMVEFWEKQASKPAVEIPIHRLSRSTRAYNLRSTKAVAVLNYDPNEQVLTAVSGWESKLPHQAHQLSAAESIGKVRTMCAKIGHTLAMHCYDQRVPGRYHACHAEKQLMAYLFEHRPFSKCADVHMNKELCTDCHQCLRLFVKATGITVTVYVHGENDGSMSAKSLPAPRATRYIKARA